MKADEPVAAFASLRRRVHLDTSVLHRLYDFGGLVWEGESFNPSARAAKVPHLLEGLVALRQIFEVNDRAHFEFVVTDASLMEVQARGRKGYTQWVRDVEETWLVQSEGVEHEPVELKRVGSVSRKDWALVLAALATGYDGLMTMDRPLASQAHAIGRKSGLRVLLPPDHRALLALTPAGSKAVGRGPTALDQHRTRVRRDASRPSCGQVKRCRLMLRRSVGVGYFSEADRSIRNARSASLLVRSSALW